MMVRGIFPKVRRWEHRCGDGRFEVGRWCATPTVVVLEVQKGFYRTLRVASGYVYGLLERYYLALALVA